jgi:hypothetical protein
MRADSKTLEANKSTKLLSLHGVCEPGAPWKLIQLHTDKPLELVVEWAAEDQRSGRIEWTVAKGGRLCLLAESITVTGTAQVADTSVSVSISDLVAPVATANVCEQRVSLPDGASASLDVPEFARAMRVRPDFGDPVLLSLTAEFLDGTGAVRALVPSTDVSLSNPVGAAAQVRLSRAAGQDIFARVIWELAV